MDKRDYTDKYIAGELHAEDLIEIIIKQEKKIKTAAEALERLANPYGNPYNPQEGVIIARDSISIAQSTLNSIK